MTLSKTAIRILYQLRRQYPAPLRYAMLDAGHRDAPGLTKLKAAGLLETMVVEGSVVLAYLTPEGEDEAKRWPK